MTIKLASWNINSVRIRLDLVQAFVAAEQPDVLCLQETKTQDEHFPAEELRAMGFVHQAIAGQKSYNGVAILSKLPLTNITITPMCGHDDKRHIGAQLPDGMWIHNFYIPAGGDIPDPIENPKFDHKLRFVDALHAWSATQKGMRTAIMGDFNIAPLEHDVWSSKQLRNVVSHTPIEREKLTAMQATIGWVDSHRQHVPTDQKLYSWWSYRNRDWAASDRGRRLDHIWLSPELAPALRTSGIARSLRAHESPSDHVPIWVTLDD
jgi:exodeoxyribonuclease III